jgi:hypothetical protein
MSGGAVQTVLWLRVGGEGAWLRIGCGQPAVNQMGLPVGRQVTETDKQRESGRWNGSAAALVTRSSPVGRESPIYRAGRNFSVLREPLMCDP